MTTDNPPSLFARLRQKFSSNILQDMDALRALLQQSHTQGIIDQDTLSRVENVLNFNQMHVRDAMISRAQMDVLKTTDSIERIIAYAVDTAHSRFPVIADDKDHIIGILHAKDLLKFTLNPEQFKLDNIIRPAVFVPESKPLNTLLKEFQEQHNHMAIVVDEYGGISGLVTFEDLIEEIARIDGYANVPDRLPVVQSQQDAGGSRSLRYYSDLLVAQGFQEAVTYSFIDNASHQAFFPECPAITLQNPISANLAEMRLSLLPGLVGAVIYNRNRQQQDLRLFECGRVFLPQLEKKIADCSQPVRVAGVMSGLAMPEQWAIEARKIDFFDAKAVVENLLVLKHSVSYRPSQQTYLHPGKSADVYDDDKGQYLGCVGALHPHLLQKLDARAGDIYVFEINDFAILPLMHLPYYQAISKFPIVRRDLAFVVDKKIAATTILKAIQEQMGKRLSDAYLFDVYQGENLGDKLSLAVALYLQDSEKTLQDEEVGSSITMLVTYLKNTFNAELR